MGESKRQKYDKLMRHALKGGVDNRTGLTVS